MKMKGLMDLYMTLDLELVVNRKRGVQPKINKNDGTRKDLRKRACKAFVRWMHDACIPFDDVNNPRFPIFIEAKWVNSGCSIMCN